MPPKSNILLESQVWLRYSHGIPGRFPAQAKRALDARTENPSQMFRLCDNPFCFYVRNHTAGPFPDPSPARNSAFSRRTGCNPVGRNERAASPDAALRCPGERHCLVYPYCSPSFRRPLGSRCLQFVSRPEYSLLRRLDRDPSRHCSLCRSSPFRPRSLFHWNHRHRVLRTI